MQRNAAWHLKLKPLQLNLLPETVKIISTWLDCNEVLDSMVYNDDTFNFSAQGAAGKTVDLQGVASFASLVEILAQELGAQPGKIQGVLPNGPATFQELVGEIPVVSHGYNRHIKLFTTPGQPLKMRIFSSWRDGLARDDQMISGVDSQFILGASVDKIIPQARALARHIEDAFAVLDKMATLGQSSRLAAMSISEAEIAKFEVEQDQQHGLLKQFGTEDVRS
ncbi:MAG: hypothetical protein K2W95_12490 [Candidatus Obscuribacterales bacterium]|nr:hypothetical protein [Candidatus Obscuribacterales bacterium]